MQAINMQAIVQSSGINWSNSSHQLVETTYSCCKASCKDYNCGTSHLIEDAADTTCLPTGCSAATCCKASC